MKHRRNRWRASRWDSFDLSPPRDEDVAEAIGLLRKGKAPGVDELQVELLQLLDEEDVVWVASELRRPCTMKRVARM